MKAIFLDIDGVLNTEFWVVHCIENGLPVHDKKHFHVFDINALQWLNHIIENTNAYIIISSSWRHSGLHALQNLWKTRCNEYAQQHITPNPYRFYNRIMDVTFSLTTSKFREQKALIKQLPEDEQDNRGKQIDIYLKTHPEITNYIIIDDDDFDIEQKSVLIKSDQYFGITQKDAMKAIEILNSKIDK